MWRRRRRRRRLLLFLLAAFTLLGASAQPRYSFRRRPPARNLSAVVPVTMDDAAADAAIRAHSFVFVGGVPQSGTSLVRSIVSASELVSGQEKCLATTRCFESNVEGQWLLDRKRDDMQDVLRVYYSVEVLQKMSGPRLLDERNVSNATAPRLFANWARYWDTSRPVLLEKSPPNLLKMGYLAAAFARARAVRFLVVLKDPITNNLFYRPRRVREALLQRAAAELGLQRTSKGVSSAEGGFQDVVVTQMAFLDDWLTAHERAVRDLERWGQQPLSSSSLSSLSSLSLSSPSPHGKPEATVAWIRYESLAGGVPCDLCRRLFRFLLSPEVVGGAAASASAPFSSPCARVARRCPNNNRGFAAAATATMLSEAGEEGVEIGGGGGGFRQEERRRRRGLLAMIDETQARARTHRGGGDFRSGSIYNYEETRKKRRERWREELRLFTAAQRRSLHDFAVRLRAFGYGFYNDQMRNKGTVIAPYLI